MLASLAMSVIAKRQEWPIHHRLRKRKDDGVIVV